MTFTTVTRTFNLSDYIGENYDPALVKVRLSTNLETGYITDNTTSEIRTGLGSVTIADDGDVSIAVPKPDATLNPTTWQTYVTIENPGAHRGDERQTITLGPFTITSSGLLSALVAQQVVPPTYVGAAVELVVNTGTEQVERVEDAGDAAVDEIEDSGRVRWRAGRGAR